MSEELKAGPELDQLVHTKVMGGQGAAPAYSSDIGVAWTIWRKFPRPKRCHITEDGVHHVLVGGTGSGADGSMQPLVWEKGPSMPPAICKAALKMVELGKM